MTATSAAQTYIVELDGKTIELEAKLAAADKKLASFEGRIASLQAANEKTALSNDVLASSFGDGGKKIEFAAGAIGAALLAIEVKATEMAAAVDGSLKQIGAASPALRTNLSGVQQSIDAVADASGRDKDEIRAAAEEISRLGASSKADFDAKLNAATLISDATGVQLQSAVEGIDQLGHAFDLSADQIVVAAAKIYSATKGKVDFEAVFGALKQSIPKIKELGIDLDTAISAIVVKLNQGYSARKLGQFFTDHDAETIRAIGAEAKISAGSLQELQDAAAFRRSGEDRDITRSLNEYKTALESLGNETLPLVIKEFSGLAGILAAIDGTLDKMKANSSVAILQQYGAIDPSKLSSKSRDEFQSRGAFAAGQLRDAFTLGQIDFQGLDVKSLTALKGGLDAYVASLRAATGPENAFNQAMIDSQFGYKSLLDNLDKVIAAKGKADSTSPAGVTGGTVKGGGGPSELTIAQKARIAAFNQGFQSQLAALTPGQGDNLEAQIQKIRDEAKAMADFVDAQTLDVEGRIQQLRGAAAQRAEVQLGVLNQDVNSQVAALSESQADIFKAASDKFIAQKRKELGAINGITDAERTQMADRITAYEVQAGNATMALRALDQLNLANKDAARNLDLFDQQAALLQAREQELTAVIETGNTPRAVRVQAEKELAALRQQQIDLANKESAALRTEIQRDQDAIDKLTQMRDQIRAVSPDDKTAEELQKTIDELTKKIAELELKLQQLGATGATQAKNQYDTTKKTNTELEKQARIVRESVSGALQLASAFGLVDSQTVSILENVAALGENLGLLAGGDIAALPGALGNVASLVSSFFGADPQEEAQKQALEANTQALIRAAQRLTELNDRLDAERAIFGDQGPLDDLQKLVAGIDKQLGTSAFGGFDTSTAEGRAALRKAIQDFFTAVQAEGGFGDNLTLGGVNGVGGVAGPDLLQGLEQIIQYLDQLDQQNGSTTSSSGTGGYNVSQQITEASADRISGLLTSQLGYAKRTAEGIEALVGFLVGANALGPITVPSIGTLGSGAGGSLGGSGGVSIAQLVVNVTAPLGMSEADAKAIGAQVGSAAVDALKSVDEGLAWRGRSRAARQTVYLT